MRQALAVAALVVFAAVLLGATAFREQVAHAAAAILNVRVVNTAGEAVPVTVGDPVTVADERQPYAHAQFVNQDSPPCTQFACHIRFPAVPAGMRLVMTYASAEYRLSSGGTGPAVRVGVNDNGSSQPQVHLPAPQPLGFDVYLAAGPITAFAEAGDVPTVTLGGQFVAPVSNTAQITLSGYLVPAP